MSNDKEKISAYLDNDLNSEELEAIEPIESESDFGVASRYQMMGEAMRGLPSDAVMIDISVQLREVLQNEKIAKQSVSQTTEQRGQQAGRPLFDFSAWFRPLGGLAVAASVALVMVVVVTQVDSPTGSHQVASTVDPITNDSEVIVQEAVSRPVVVAIEKEQPRNLPAINLDAYLAEHAEFAAQDTLQGRMPYARAVSYDSE